MNGEQAPTGRGGSRSPFGVRRSSFTLLASLFGVLLLSSITLLRAQDPVFRSGSSDLVVLPVVVTDKQGGYVSDLPRERFMVYDNGRRVPIDLFTNQDAPVTVGLIIDASGSMQAKIADVIAASLTFARSSNPEDELFALRFNDDVQEMVPDRPFLMAADLGALESAVRAIRIEGRTALYDGLMAGLDHLDKGARVRKALIVISDGGDNASAATLDRVQARARRSNAAIYTIGIYDEDDVDKDPGVLKSLANNSGGERYLPRSPSDLSRIGERIARDIRGGYTIGYVPPARDGAYHRVKIEIDKAADKTAGTTSNRRLDVRTRPGYFAAMGAAQP